MAEAKPLKRGSTGFEELTSSDTFPATSLPARVTISPSQITSDQDNYAPTGWADADVIRLNFDTGGRAITGLTAWTNGRPKTLLNISGNFAYIPCEHPDSSAANRATGASDHVIAPYGTMIVEYDSTTSRVRVLGNSFNPAAPGIGNLFGHFYLVNVGSITAADWGDFGFAVSGTGSSLNTASPTFSVPGSWTLGTGTTTTGAAVAYLSKNILNPTYYSSAHIIASTQAFFTTLSDGTNTYTFSFGLVPSPSSTTLDVNNSVVIKYSSGLNSGKFLGVCRDNAGTETTADLGTTVAVDTPYVLTVCFDKARTEARFYVNGAFAARITANVPNAVAVGERIAIVKSAGTTSRTASFNILTLSTVY